MKLSLCRFGIVLLILALCPAAFANCIATVASQTAPFPPFDPNAPGGGPGFVTPDTTNTPANMVFGSTSQLSSELLLTDDGGGTNCFSLGSIVITFNGVLTNIPILGSTIVVYDSTACPSCIAGYASVTKGVSSSVMTITITHAGTSGTLLGGNTGSAILLRNLKFDVSQLAANAFLTATAATFNQSGTLLAALAPVNLGVIAASGTISITPTAITFPDQLVNTTSAPQQITLVNTGTSDLIVSNVQVSSSLFTQQNTCGSAIPARSFCTISASFTPTSLGGQSGTITVTDNAVGTPHTINLNGTGIASPGTPVISSISPSAVIAGGPSFTLTVTGTNFVSGSVVLWNSVPRPTTFQTSTVLLASIPATDIVAVGSAGVAVSNAGSVSNPTSVTILANPRLQAPFVYAIPHIVQGGGYVTKITMMNPGGTQVAVTILYLDQSGNALTSANYTIAAGGTLRISTPAAARSGAAQPPQWAMVGATGKVNINTFLELTDASGKVVLNTVGFNTPDSLTDFSVPVEYAPATSTTFATTTGIALANVSDVANTVTLQLLNSNGFQSASDTITVPPFGQRAIDLTDATKVPNIATSFTAAPFVGTLGVFASAPMSAVALVDDVGQFAATPVAQGRSTLSVDQITAVCPSAFDVNAINTDVHLSFEQDPTAGTLVCRALEGSADLTQLQRNVYQALRIMKNVAWDAPFPFTNTTLYQWLIANVKTIRIRGDITTSFCCDQAGSIDVAANLSSPFLQTNTWLGPYNASANSGINFLPTEFARLARQAQAFPDTCGDNDQTISEMGPWAVAMDVSDYTSAHGGTFFNDLIAGEFGNRYRAVAANDAAAFVTAGRFCNAPGIQVQGSSLNFGTQGFGDLPAWRAVAISAGTAGTTTTIASTTTSTDFPIVSDSCAAGSHPPSCTVVVGFAPKSLGSVNGTLTLGTASSTTIPLTGFSTSAVPVPTANYLYVLPHVVTGGGFVSKITLNNLVGVPNDVVVRFVSQAGTILQATSYQLTAGGSLRINVNDPSTRFNASVTEWAVIGSRQPLNANIFFDYAFSQGGAIVNAIGFNAAPALTSMQVPVEFERKPDGTFGRMVGLALANPSASAVTYTLTLLDASGNTAATYQGTIGAYGQTATDLSQIPAFNAVLPAANFVGSVKIAASAPLSALALGDDFGPFSATPPVPLP